MAGNFLRRITDTAGRGRSRSISPQRWGALIGGGALAIYGQTPMMRYMKPLLETIQKGEFDPSFVISHRVPIDRAPEMYKIFRDKKENCTKVVLDPWAEGASAA